MYGKTRQPVAFRPILLIATIIYVSITTLFWTRIGWFFEDAWHWLKRRRIIRRLTDPRYCSLINGPFVEDEDLTDEDIHEIMDLIHKGNPPKYEIRRKEESSKVLGRSKRQSRTSNPILFVPKSRPRIFFIL